MTSGGKTGRPRLGIADGTKPARRALLEAMQPFTEGFYGKDLAEFCGESPSKISRFLNGLTLPPWNTVERIHAYVLAHGTFGEPPARAQWYVLYLAAAEESGRAEVQPEAVRERRRRVRGAGGVYQWVTESAAARAGALGAVAAAVLGGLVLLAVKVVWPLLWEGGREVARAPLDWTALSTLAAAAYGVLKKVRRMRKRALRRRGMLKRQEFIGRMTSSCIMMAPPPSHRPDDSPPEP